MASTPEAGAALIVSGADPAYFPYLQELWSSYRQSGADRLARFAALDLGLEASQLDWLKSRSVLVAKPDWPYPGLQGEPEWFKAMVCRPFLPALFPGHDFLFWIDADSWIQDAGALELFLHGARGNGFAVVPAVDRAYRPRFSSDGWFLDWQKACLETGFGPQIAEQFFRYPIISAGALCGHAQAPHWALWQQATGEALRRAVYREAEQTALSLTVHRQVWSVHLLPSYCHWVCNMALPAVDRKRALFVEPYHPHMPIGVMGLAANTKDERFPLSTLDGEKVTCSLRYGSLGGPSA